MTEREAWLLVAMAHVINGKVPLNLIGDFTDKVIEQWTDRFDTDLKNAEPS